MQYLYNSSFQNNKLTHVIYEGYQILQDTCNKTQGHLTRLTEHPIKRVIIYNTWYITHLSIIRTMTLVIFSTKGQLKFKNYSILYRYLTKKGLLINEMHLLRFKKWNVVVYTEYRSTAYSGVSEVPTPATWFPKYIIS